MFNRLRVTLLLILLLPVLQADHPPFIVGQLECELGNNLFQVATTCALAWDHQAEPLFPDLINRTEDHMALNYRHVFFRCNASTPSEPITVHWSHPVGANFCHAPIPYFANMAIKGVFQCEKYFARHRHRLLKLFAPNPKDLSYIQNKYGHLLDHPKTVGIQMRWFGRQHDAPWWPCLAQYGYDYFKKAIALFPEDCLFIVSTNNLEFAKQNLPQGLNNVLILEEEPYYIDFYLLSLCKHLIMSNSTFGWWAAWLNQNPQKIIIAPSHWINPAYETITPTDVIPEEWIKLKAKWETPQGMIKEIR